MDLMIDLETLDVGEFPALLSIAGQLFDPHTTQLGENFHYKIDPQSCVRIGGTVGTDTFFWWLRQSEEARSNILEGTRCNVSYVVDFIQGWCDCNEIGNIWSHGSDFDIRILAKYFQALNKRVPWSFRNVRDTRTVYAIGDTFFDKWDAGIHGGVAHDALSDAVFQSKKVQKVYSLIQSRS